MAPPKILGICKVDGCTNDAVSLHYCNLHYKRLRRLGGTNLPSEEEKARQKIEKKTIPEPNSGCLIWLGSADVAGYGLIRFRGSNWLTHRAAWEVFRGPIPDGSFVCHKCDVKPCVNPDHLYIGDAATNAQDRVDRKRQAFGERHGSALLTAAQVREIYNDPRPHSEIAKDHGVTTSAIQKICTGVNWSHVDYETPL